MKRNFYTIDPTISPDENMKKLVNPIFPKEISLDILIGHPPKYDDLKISGIYFHFLRYLGSHFGFGSESKEIKYLRLHFDLRRNKYSHKHRSIRIIDQKIDITYLKKVFYNFKNLKEADEARYLEIQNNEREKQEELHKIRARNNIEYPKIYLYTNQDKFQLSFNHITEDEVDSLMSYYWNRINKK